MTSKKCPMCKGQFRAETKKQVLCKECQKTADKVKARAKLTVVGNVTQLGAAPRRTVAVALAEATEDVENYSDIMILGYDKNTGELSLLSSNMNNAEVNYMLDSAKMEIFHPEETDHDAPGSTA